jgi:hypothetical protein
MREFPIRRRVLMDGATRVVSLSTAEATMCGRRNRVLPLLLLGSLATTTGLAGQAPPDVCSLATSEEFQRAHGVNPKIGILPDTPEYTKVSWGHHCDFSQGAIDLFTSKAELERVLGLTHATKDRAAVSGLGKSAFFTVVYPGDKYRERGLLAIDTGKQLVAVSLDHDEADPVATTRPKLEGLAKLVLPRLE